MKRLLIIFPIVFIITLRGFGQDNKLPKTADRFRFQFDLTGSFSSFQINGPADLGNGAVTLINNHEVIKAPVYKYSSEKFYTTNCFFHGSLNRK